MFTKSLVDRLNINYDFLSQIYRLIATFIHFNEYIGKHYATFIHCDGYIGNY
jgi:hypothetical protein